MNIDQRSDTPRLLATLLAAFLSVGTGTTHAAGAHIHGQGNLDITIEPGRVHLLLIAPTGDLRTEDSTESTLISRDDLFAFPDSGCALHTSKVEDSSVFTEVWAEDGEHSAGSPDEGHSDTYLSWTYRCALPPAKIQVKLFSATQLQKLVIQVASESGVIPGEATVDAPEMDLPKL
jgi:hypothetical protein